MSFLKNKNISIRFPKSHPFREDLPKEILRSIIKSELTDDEIIEDYPLFLICAFSLMNEISKDERKKM